MATAQATHAPRTGPSQSFAGQLAGLLHPGGELIADDSLIVGAIG